MRWNDRRDTANPHLSFQKAFRSQQHLLYLHMSGNRSIWMYLAGRLSRTNIRRTSFSPSPPRTPPFPPRVTASPWPVAHTHRSVAMVGEVRASSGRGAESAQCAFPARGPSECIAVSLTWRTQREGWR